MVIENTSHNDDKSERRQQKRRHAKTATTKTATTVVKTATVHKSKRRQLLVKTATVIGQNGEDLWSKRRQPMVETATTNGQNGDINKSITQTCDTIPLHLMTHYNCYRYSNVVSKKPTDPV